MDDATSSCPQLCPTLSLQMSLSVNESTIISIPSDNSEHHVRRGEVFLRDSPVAHALLPSKRQSYCDGCLIPSATLEPCEICAQMLYCSKSCKDSMKLPHELECKQYLAVGRFPVAEIRLLLRVCCIQDTAIRQAINKLMSHEEHFKKDQKFISDFAGLIQTIASFTGGTLPLPECELFSLLCRIRINSFVITDQWGADLGAGLFLQAARLDHSCKPNIEYMFRGKEIICFALEDMKDRSEVIDLYLIFG
ncbi:hypothetical protein D915_010893 [Fasciola hepatica]|uniref:MYND-type domain-containing protein n=1 Tax=Fasciola hepatica TaxID=6192 RepID=A0A4E0QUC2_FASHE|nr:hypothetical protein D915_010893 [Fasciola hepatica]